MAPHVSKSMSNTRRCQLIRTKLTAVVISLKCRTASTRLEANSDAYWHTNRTTHTHFEHNFEISIINLLNCNRHVCFRFFLFLFIEPRKEKTDVSCSGGGGGGVNGGNNALSPNNEQGCQGGLMQQGSGGLNNHHLSTPKLERPNSLGGSNKISRRIVCYHGDHCKYIHCKISLESSLNLALALHLQHPNVVCRAVHHRRTQISIIITKYKAIYYYPNCQNRRFHCQKSVRFHRRRCFQHLVRRWWPVDRTCNSNQTAVAIWIWCIHSKLITMITITMSKTTSMAMTSIPKRSTCIKCSSNRILTQCAWKRYQSKSRCWMRCRRNRHSRKSPVARDRRRRHPIRMGQTDHLWCDKTIIVPWSECSILVFKLIHNYIHRVTFAFIFAMCTLIFQEHHPCIIATRMGVLIRLCSKLTRHYPHEYKYIFSITYTILGLFFVPGLGYGNLWDSNLVLFL